MGPSGRVEWRWWRRREANPIHFISTNAEWDRNGRSTVQKTNMEHRSEPPYNLQYTLGSKLSHPQGVYRCGYKPSPANQVGKGLTHPHPRKKERMFDGGGYYRPAVWENASCPRAQAVLVPACRRVTGSKKWTSGSDECDEKFCFSFLGFQKQKNSVGRRWAWRGRGRGRGGSI